MRCATGTPATGAHINAHTKAHINARIIFPRTSIPSEMARTPFCQLRTSFWAGAHTIWLAAHTILGWRAHHFRILGVLSHGHAMITVSIKILASQPQSSDVSRVCLNRPPSLPSIVLPTFPKEQ